MKKIILLLLLLTAVFMVNAQTITINSIGMQGENGAGDFDISQNEDITLRVNYTSSGLVRPNKVQGYSFDGNNGQIMLVFYSSSTPDEGAWQDEIYFTVPISSNSQNGTFDLTTTFNIGTFTGNAVSIQAALQLYTSNGVYSSAYTSHQVDSVYNTILPANSPATGFSSYLTVYSDTETEAPTLYTPSSPTVATYDNSSLLIDFELAEQANPGSVKLYFSPNSDGSSPSTTLTLASTYENTTRHQITLDASIFSTASTHIAAVSGSTSLTHLNTYYVAIGYQDELVNPEETSPWHKLIYDNVAIAPTAISGSSGSGSNFNVNFTLLENSANDGITIFIQNSTTLAIISTVSISGSYSTGSNSVSLDGANLLGSAVASSVSGLNSLDSGDTFRFSIEMVDLAGNSITSSTGSSFQYLNQNITITAMAAVHNPGNALLGYNSGAYQPIGYVGLKTDSGSANLTGLEIIVSGTIDPGDASYLALYESTTTSFSSAVSISNPILFTGTGNYSFSINNRTLTDQNKYYFVAISLNSAGLTYCDRIEISTNDALITTSGTVNTFEPGIFAGKCLYRALILNYFDDFPAISPGTPNTPFFRLDVRTNQGTSSITSLKIKLNGTLTSNDVVSTGFKVWESTSTTFDPSKAKATQIGGSANYDEILTFSGFNSTVTDTQKYYYFTVSTTETANTEATIGGIINEESYVGTNTSTTVEADNTLTGFPINGDEQTLPVELSAFSALIIANNHVKIEWTVETETGLSGYYLLKNTSNDMNSAVQIPVLIPSINSSQTYTYSFVDREVENNAVYYYWLKTVELSNESEFFGPAIVTIGDPDYNDTPEVILGTKLYENYPNPFNPSTNISFSLTKPENVTIKIYNVKGQLVKTLFDDFVTTINKKHRLVWDGRDNQNNNVASGIYYTKMTAGKHTEFKKMLLMK